MGDRLLSLDKWKGIAILCVILIHSIGAVINPFTNTIDTYLAVIARQFINIAVPVFLFISGFLSARSSNVNGLMMIYKRAKRILIPYVIWGATYTLYRYIFGVHITTSYVTYGLLTGSIIEVGYFVMVIMQYVVISVLLDYVKKIKTHLYIIISISICGISFTYSNQFSLITGVMSNFPFSAIIFFVWYPFFHLGYVLSRYKINMPKMKFIILAICCSLLSSFLEAFYFLDHKYGLATSQLKFTSIVMSIFVCLYIYKTVNKPQHNKCLISLGTLSYGVYLSHILVMKIIVRIFNYYGIIIEDKLLMTIFLFISTTIISFGVCYLISILSPKYKHLLVG